MHFEDSFYIFFGHIVDVLHRHRVKHNANKTKTTQNKIFTDYYYSFFSDKNARRLDIFGHFVQQCNLAIYQYLIFSEALKSA